MSKPSPKTDKNSAKKIITTDKVYKPVGPYSQAVVGNKTVYVSGVLGLDADLNMLCSIEDQARQALENLKEILEASNSSIKGVVKTTILLVNLEHMSTVNKLYSEYFHEDRPARAAFQVSKLPCNALIEIEAIAIEGVKDDIACPCSKQQLSCQQLNQR